ncbi:MAG: hypothetical protein DHS20C02_04590 [Micavibrio sp.]|nr:MAG: hypothetical protein DHS20C02_04590 [Micavibrio sp.]
MSLKLRIVLGLFCAVLIPLGAFAVADLASDPHVTIHTSGGDTHRFNIELAVTPEEMAKGLMNRTELAPDAGMLFMFSNEAPRSFWMRNTLIPLDIIFIKADGKIHHIHPMALPLDETGVLSNGAARAVLEINGGKASELGIQAGDTVRW